MNIVTLYFVYKLHLNAVRQSSKFENLQQQLDDHEKHCEERKKDSVKARDGITSQLLEHERKTDESLVRIYDEIRKNDKKTQESFSNVHKKIEVYAWRNIPPSNR